jgi:excisionase family DNA binding protein
MKLIKTSEAARLMGVTRQAIYYLIKTEKVYFYLVGKRIYIPEFELDKLLYLLMTADGIESELAADFFAEAVKKAEATGIDTHKDIDKEPWVVYRNFRKERISKQLTKKQKDELIIKVKDYFLSVKNLQI